MPVRPPTSAELNDPESALDYAEHVLGAKFPDGEEAIARDSWTASYYAKYILKGRFPEGEKAIFTSWNRGDDYTKFLQLNDPEGYAEYQLEHGDWAPDKVAEAALVLARRAT